MTTKTTECKRQEEIECLYDDIFQKKIAVADYIISRMAAHESVEWNMMMDVVSDYKSIHESCI